ncbi:hypothetical protein CBS101457_005099 [Exobasidium rhododendri]|nr:hypothetical protein CBS101457_005099 [Exobasidium rhododendri]
MARSVHLLLFLLVLVALIDTTSVTALQERAALTTKRKSPTTAASTAKSASLTKRKASSSSKHTTTTSTKRVTSTSTKKTSTTSTKRASTTSTKRASTTSTKRASTTSTKIASTTSTKRASTSTSTTKGVTSTSLKAPSSSTITKASSKTSSTTSTTVASSSTATSTSISIPPPPALKILYQNDANWTRAASPLTRQASYLLYPSSVVGSSINATCASVGEVPVILNGTVEPGLALQLQYLISDGSYSSGQTYWIQANSKNGSLYCTSVEADESSVTLVTHLCSKSFPVLCTNSAPRSTSKAASLNANYSISVNGFTAYRDALSFRFIQTPYADTPTRFTASNVYVPAVGKAVPGRSPQCPQPGYPNTSYWEDCLVANVYTSVIAQGTNNFTLRPIMMFIHGGGFQTGTGLDPVFDGGSLASRGDVVVVTPNYRLGTLGFLSINDDYIGNYALSDLINCLKWIKANAATFGGDPEQITILGQSAGAQFVSTLIASPAAAGLFQNAIVQSGRPADYANSHQTAAAAQAGPCNVTLTSLGCANDTNVITCLQGLPTSAFLSGTVYSKGVIDGNLIVERNVDVAQTRGGYVNKVPVIMGFMRDEMASLGYTPPLSQTNLDAALVAGGINSTNRAVVESNSTTLFPVDQTVANSIQNLTITVETDSTSIRRCGQESTIKAAADSGVFTNIWGYSMDQRSYQIKGYDPYNVCTSTTSATKGYYLCHSGDLLPLFNTAGYTASYPIRDADDVVHTALMMDYWTSFARSGKPNPSQSYLTVRGYYTTARLVNDNPWNPTTSSSLELLSLGPNPYMQDLHIRQDQCSALGLPIDYVAEGI